MDTLKRRVDDDTKTALRAGDKRRLGTLRLILAAIKQREVDERVRLDDAGVLQVLDKMVKQRKESLAIYTQAKRADLAGQEASSSGSCRATCRRPSMRRGSQPSWGRPFRRSRQSPCATSAG